MPTRAQQVNRSSAPKDVSKTSAKPVLTSIHNPSISNPDQQRAADFKAAHPEVAYKVPDAITRAQLKTFNQEFKFNGHGRQVKNRGAKKLRRKEKARNAQARAGQR